MGARVAEALSEVLKPGVRPRLVCGRPLLSVSLGTFLKANMGEGWGGGPSEVRAVNAHAIIFQKFSDTYALRFCAHFQNHIFSLPTHHRFMQKRKTLLWLQFL